MLHVWDLLEVQQLRNGFGRKRRFGFRWRWHRRRKFQSQRRGQHFFDGGAHVFNPGTSFSGSGFGISILTGGTLSFGGTVGTGTGDFALNGGAIDTTGSLSIGRLLLARSFAPDATSITSGTLIATNGLFIFSDVSTPGALVNLTGTGILVNSGPNGAFNGSGSGFVLGSGGAVIHNAPGGVFDAKIDSVNAFATSGGSPTINNAGVFKLNHNLGALRHFLDLQQHWPGPSRKRPTRTQWYRHPIQRRYALRWHLADFCGWDIGRNWFRADHYERSECDPGRKRRDFPGDRFAGR